MIAVSVRHNFETAHRLPHLPGKCTSLHGHSWWVKVTVEADETDPNGMVVDFGELKRGLRGWIDENLDHGTMLGWGDDLVKVLERHGKVFVFGGDVGDWPTVENVALLLREVTMKLTAGCNPPVRVVRVEVQEKHDNEASWSA